MAGSPLIGLLCLAARLASLWGRVSAFLKKLLIGSAEGKFLSTVTARNLHISGHRTPCVGLYSPNHVFFARILLEFQKAAQNEAFQGAKRPGGWSRYRSFYEARAAHRARSSQSAIRRKLREPGYAPK